MAKLYLFYNDYETTYINHARLHRCLRSDGLRVGVPGGNPPVWLDDHLVYRLRVSNLGRSGERRVR